MKIKDEQFKSNPAVHPFQKPFYLLCSTTLLMGAVPALAQDLAQDIVQLPVAAAAVHVTPDVTETSSPAVVSPAAVPPRNRADAAATVALAALLPHLANNDTIPLMDRSAMFAGDLNRALTGYDVSQSTLAAAEKAVTDKRPKSSLDMRCTCLVRLTAGVALVFAALIAVAWSIMCSVLHLGSSCHVSRGIWRVTLVVS